LLFISTKAQTHTNNTLFFAPKDERKYCLSVLHHERGRRKFSIQIQNVFNVILHRNIFSYQIIGRKWLLVIGRHQGRRHSYAFHTTGRSTPEETTTQAYNTKKNGIIGNELGLFQAMFAPGMWSTHAAAAVPESAIQRVN